MITQKIILVLNQILRGKGHLHERNLGQVREKNRLLQRLIKSDTKSRHPENPVHQSHIRKTEKTKMK